jgi:hypothetical protein
MIKPDSLRRHLLATIDTLRDDPDRLQIYVDKGRVACTGTGSLSFEYRYTLTVLLTDFAGSPDSLIVPMLAWLAHHQPDLLERDTREPVAIEVELLAQDLVDVQLQVELTEGVGVKPRAGGGYTVDHWPEPVRDPPFAGVPDRVTLWQLFLRDTLIAEGDIDPTRGL